MRSSPNLDRYRRDRRHVNFLNVYVKQGDDWRTSKDVVYLGEVYDGFLMGTQLNRILVGDMQLWSYMESHINPNELVDVTAEFWALYDEIGRCAFDANHKQHFQSSDDRYTENGDERTCNWCGVRQIKKSRERVITDEWWEVVVHGST